MASFGAKRPIFNPIDTQPEGERPTYKEEKPLEIGKLIKAERTVTMASGKLYANDELAESVDEFVSGNIAMETDDMVDEVATVMYGATVSNKEVSYKAGDTAPEGGLAYYKVLMRSGKKVYKGYFYPRVKAVLGNDTAQTKGDSITFGTSATNFTVFRCNSDEWVVTEEFETEAACVEWCDEKLKHKAQEAA